MDTHTAARGGVFKRVNHLRTPLSGKVDDVLTELLIEFVFDPRHVFALHTATSLDALKTYVGREVEEEHGVAIFQSFRQRPREIAVEDQASSSRILCNRSSNSARVTVVRWIVPQHVQIMQRQSGRIPQPARERAFACTRTSDDKHTAHTTVSRNRIHGCRSSHPIHSLPATVYPISSISTYRLHFLTGCTLKQIRQLYPTNHLEIREMSVIPDTFSGL